MAKSKRCPACSGEMPADAKDCPSCPFSFADEDDAPPPGRSSAAPAAWHPAVWAGLLAVLGVGAWQGLNYVIHHAADEAPGGGAVQEAASPGTVEIIAAAPPLASDAGRIAVPSVPAREALPELAAPAPEAPQGEPLIAVTAASPEPEEPLPAEWRLRGVVYDLETLKPLAGCAMVFSDAQSNTRRETMTDGQGRYRIIVPPLSGRGYSAAINHPGYAKAYLDPEAQGVSGISEEQRRWMAAELLKSLHGPYVVEPRGAEPKVTDFYLAPLPR